MVTRRRQKKTLRVEEHASKKRGGGIVVTPAQHQLISFSGQTFLKEAIADKEKSQVKARPCIYNQNIYQLVTAARILPDDQVTSCNSELRVNCKPLGVS